MLFNAETRVSVIIGIVFLSLMTVIYLEAIIESIEENTKIHKYLK